jgi:chromosome segregation ATPase
MYEEDTSPAPEVPVESGQNNVLRYIIVALAVIYVAASLYFIFDMHSRIEKLEAAQKADAESAATHNAAIMKKLGMTEASLEQAAEKLQSKLGETQKDVVSRTSQLAKQQQASEQRLRQESEQKIGAVAGEVGGVKTEVAGAKTDIAATRTDLEATKAKLQSAIGDLGVQSGLIAHTREELDYLKHRGDRNIFEFTLKKGEHPKPVSTISLQLKKVDAKKGKFSMNVIADDRTIEKKDRTVNEPMQFYTGRDRSLYEVVVMTAAKNTVSGYLSTPKTVPAPAGN